MVAPYKPLLKFALERESIRRKKEAGEPWPWTKDPILRDHRFTNVHRHNDKVTKWIVNNLTRPNKDHPDLWFLCVVARIFNRIETLQALKDAGCLSLKHWNADKAYRVLSKLREDGPVFNGAYIVASPVKDKVKYFTHTVLQKAWYQRQDISAAFQERSNRTMEQATRIIKKLHGFGPFLAYEVVLDLKLTPLLRKAPDLQTWTSFGPGSMRGLSFLYGRKIKRAEALPLIREVHAELVKHWPREYETLDLDDTENLLCETSKVARFQKGGRIKQRYRGPKNQLEMDL